VRVSDDAPLSLDSFHLDGPNGRLYALALSPPRGVATELSVLVCPPFAEEQNRTRRAVQLAARRMVRHGCSVLLLDLHGTGDSAGGGSARGRFPGAGRRLGFAHDGVSQLSQGFDRRSLSRAPEMSAGDGSAPAAVSGWSVPI